MNENRIKNESAARQLKQLELKIAAFELDVKRLKGEVDLLRADNLWLRSEVGRLKKE